MKKDLPNQKFRRLTAKEVVQTVPGKGIINPKPTILRRLPPVKIVFDAVLMLYDLAGGMCKV